MINFLNNINIFFILSLFITDTTIIVLPVKKIAGLLGEVKEKIEGAYQVVRKSFRNRIIESFKKDPFLCKKCGGIMRLVSIWHPDYGEILLRR